MREVLKAGHTGIDEASMKNTKITVLNTDYFSLKLGCLKISAVLFSFLVTKGSEWCKNFVPKRIKPCVSGIRSGTEL